MAMMRMGMMMRVMMGTTWMSTAMRRMIWMRRVAMMRVMRMDLDEHSHDKDGHDDDDLDEHSHDDEGHDEDDLDEHSHDDHSTNPHLWFDFDIVSKAVDRIAEQLSPLVSDTVALDRCVASYQSQLIDTENFVSQTLRTVPEPNRVIVTQHQTLELLADRYGYTILGSVIPSSSTLADADIKNLIELQESIQQAGAKAIFVDASGDNSAIRNFARQAGVPVVLLYTETLSPPGSDADSYLKLMRTNAQAIADALMPML